MFHRSKLGAAPATTNIGTAMMAVYSQSMEIWCHRGQQAAGLKAVWRPYLLLEHEQVVVLA